MKTPDVPRKPFVPTNNPHLSAAYQIAAVLNIGGLSHQEKSALIKQWSSHMIVFIKSGRNE